MEMMEHDFSVLVVDDNEINLMLMEDILEVIDVKHVKTVDSGEGAIDEIKQNPNYDVVVMDICMPVIDGYEASKRIRQLGYSGQHYCINGQWFTKDDPKFWKLRWMIFY